MGGSKIPQNRLLPPDRSYCKHAKRTQTTETDPDYLVNARMTFAEMCRKKMDPINESESTRTIKGSLEGDD